MQSILDLNIQKMFPRKVYQRGLSYYKKDQVSDLLYDLNHDLWTANIHSHEECFVEIDVSNLSTRGSIIAYCDCPAFHTHDTCEHIVAVLLKISEKEAEGKELEVKNLVMPEEFIEALVQENQNNIDNFQEKTPLHVEYECLLKEDGNFYLQLRTGEKRCFVVRNIYKFLTNVLKKRRHYFTKTFTYIPGLHTFLEQDQEIFHYLYDIYQNETFYLEASEDRESPIKRTSYRSLPIPPILIKELLEKLSERDLRISIHEEAFHRPQIIEGDLPISFLIDKNKEKQLQLKISQQEKSFYVNHYELLISEKAIYFPTKEQVSILEKIDRLGWEDRYLWINEDQMSPFLSEAIPSLKKVGHVQFSEIVSEKLIQRSLQAKLSLDLRGQRIIGKLVYMYGDYHLDPFKDNSHQGAMIIRNMVKENEIMRLIEKTNFKYNGAELYVALNDAGLYNFLHTEIPILKESLDVYLSEQLKNLIIKKEPALQTNVSVESSTQLLEINFDVEGIEEEEVEDLLQAVIEKRRFYRLRRGSFLPLSGGNFTSLEQFLKELNIKQKDIKDGTVKLPVYRGSQVNEWITKDSAYDASFKKLLNYLKSPSEQSFPIPENLQASLRQYQKIGYQWFRSLSEYQLGGILADDMGLGKTIQTIAYLLSEPKGQPHLVVVPSSVVYNWKNECQNFAPDLSCEVMVGTPEERQKKIRESMHVNLWVTSYATLRQDIELYQDIAFQNLILDEAQYIKNPDTKTWEAMSKINAKKRFALSGTPIENSIEELWSIFQIILPGFLPPRQEFSQLSHEKISRMTRPFILRRIKEDVLKELPEKIESKAISELTEDQKKLYMGYLKRLQHETSEVLQQGSFHDHRMKILAGLTRLRQICCHPSLFLENYDGCSGKLEQLLEMINHSLNNNKRMLIFSQFTSMHEIIIKELEKQSLDYFYLHGQTPSEERVKMSERFNQGERDIFLISLRAGGTGLNLTGADMVILYDLWWNPAVEDQAMGRAHRYGQKNSVQVIRLITEGTIEEKIYDLQQKKRSLLDRIVQPGESMLTSLSEEDVRELLNI